MFYRMFFRFCIIILLYALEQNTLCSAQLMTVTAGENVTIPCTSVAAYPVWTGPEIYNGFTMNYNNPGNSNFANPNIPQQKKARLDWASDNKSLIIRNVTVTDKGLYQCSGQTNISVRVSPQTPAISNVVKLEDNHEVVYGNEGQSLTIQCISHGGYPAPTVVWYKDSISGSNEIASTNIGIIQGDGTYIVTLKHTFTPTASDEKKTLICRSYYPQADRGSKSKSVILYLTLKPSQPTVIQTAVVSTGDTVEVSCRTTGGRPAANISWSYQGSTTSGEVTASLDTATATYTVESVFRRQVTAEDNGQNVKCFLTHPALVDPPDRTASINLRVEFEPSTTLITGNKEMIATGQTALTLTCTTGSSNPASDITWKNGSVTLTNSRSYTSSAGDNNGVVRSQQLVLYPTRHMDGDEITCSVSNIVSQSNVSDTITLSLKYRPLIQSMSDVISVEGNSTIITCVAVSKPASTFKWYRVGQSSILSQGTGTLDSNKWSYTIINVRRTDAATYRCNANNGVETADNENVLLTVYYPPDITAVTTNTTVKSATALLTCNARGVPNSDYRYDKWIQTWPGYNIPISENSANEQLVLTYLTYEHSGVYTCSASNGIKVFGTNKEFKEGSVYLLVKSFPIITKYNEKIPGRLKENATVEILYYSNGARSDINIYKNMNGSRQAGVIYTVSEDHTEVDLPVFSHIIKSDGTRARILIQIQWKDDFGFYDVVVSNEIDSSVRTFKIVPIGPPSGPINITVDNIQQNTARVSWNRGFHGGFAQTFLIQLSTDMAIWRNVETVYGGTEESNEPMYKVLTNLQESTTYHILMYAFNSEGNSPFSESHNFTTLSISEITGNSAAVTAGAVGGTISALIVIVVIVIIIVLVRRGIITKDSIRTRIQIAIVRVGKRQKDPSETETDGQDNSIRMYEHLQHTPDSGQTNVYDALKVDHETTGNSKSQYENLPQSVSTSPTYMNISPGKLNKNVNQTYENLKLRSDITDEQ